MTVRGAQAEDDRDQRDQRNDEPAAKLARPRPSRRRRDFACAAAVAAADACADARVGAVIKATDAAAAISPLKATSASPFAVESDRLDFCTLDLSRAASIVSIPKRPSSEKTESALFIQRSYEDQGPHRPKEPFGADNRARLLPVLRQRRRGCGESQFVSEGSRTRLWGGAGDPCLSPAATDRLCWRRPCSL